MDTIEILEEVMVAGLYSIPKVYVNFLALVYITAITLPIHPLSIGGTTKLISTSFEWLELLSNTQQQKKEIIYSNKMLKIIINYDNELIQVISFFFFQKYI